LPDLNTCESIQNSLKGALYLVEDIFQRIFHNVEDVVLKLVENINF